MTNEEALKYIQRKSKLIATVPRSTVEGTEAFDACEFFKTAAKALVNEEKYRWHDLRKNPNDLPEENTKVLTVHSYYHFSVEEDLCEYEIGSRYKDMFFFSGGNGKNSKVLAWKYIEPFEGEEE